MRIPRCSVPACIAPARLYVFGRRCAGHAPPAPPIPPAGTTSADLHAATASRAATFTDLMTANQTRLARHRADANSWR